MTRDEIEGYLDESRRKMNNLERVIYSFEGLYASIRAKELELIEKKALFETLQRDGLLDQYNKDLDSRRSAPMFLKDIFGAMKFGVSDEPAKSLSAIISSLRAIRTSEILILCSGLYAAVRELGPSSTSDWGFTEASLVEINRAIGNATRHIDDWLMKWGSHIEKLEGNRNGWKDNVRMTNISLFRDLGASSDASRDELADIMFEKFCLRNSDEFYMQIYEHYLEDSTELQRLVLYDGKE